MYRILIIPMIIMGLFLYSCEDSTNPSTDAILWTIDELVQNPSEFFWFSTEYNAYQPEQSIIDDLKTAYDPDEHKLLIFAKGSCSCSLVQKAFPQMCKVLKIASIPDSLSEIYSMHSNVSNHPYKGMITIDDFPVIMLLKNGQPHYSITDTLDEIKTSFPDSSSVEHQLLLALRK